MLTETLPIVALTHPLPSTWPRQASPPVFVTLTEPMVPSVIQHPRSSSVLSLLAEWAESGDTVTVLDPATLVAGHGEFGRNTAAQLVEYRDLRDNWDGEGATAPSIEAVSEALEMLAATPVWLGAPKPMVLPSGDVALYWDSDGQYAEIGFDGSGTYYAFATAPGQPPAHLDDIPLRGSDGRCLFPDAIQHLLPPRALPAAA